jgi:predicted nucleotidyltransferase
MVTQVTIVGTVLANSPPRQPERIAEVLFGGTRRNVLALLLGRPDQKFYLREIARETGAGLGALQRELAQLVEAGLILRAPHGRQVYFSANTGSPVFEELRSILDKTAGLADVLRSALLDFHERIDAAFVYGSVATGRQTSESDVDLFVVGTLRLGELLPVLARVQRRVGRAVNATIHRPEELLEKYRAREHFVRRVLERRKLMLIGSDDELARLVGESLADGV